MKRLSIAVLAMSACISVNATDLPVNLICKAKSGDITFLHNTGSFPQHLEVQGDLMSLRSAMDEGIGTSYIYSKTEGSRGYVVWMYNNGTIMLMDGNVDNGYYQCIEDKSK